MALSPERASGPARSEGGGGTSSGQHDDGHPADGYVDHAVRDHLVRRSEEHTSELQSRPHLVCRLLLEKKIKTRHAYRSMYYTKPLRREKNSKWNKPQKQMENSLEHSLKLSSWALMMVMKPNHKKDFKR